MKNFTKVMALLLVLTLMVGILPASAEASPLMARDYKIVAIGDSTANGHGLDDAGFYSDHDIRYPSGVPYYVDYDFEMMGFLEAGSDNAYPSRLAAYIQNQHPNWNVSFTNLAISGLRSTELRAILDDSYEGDSWTGPFLENTLRRLAAYYGIPDLGESFRQEIRSANLITLDICQNSFTDYLSKRLSELLDGDPENDALYEKDDIYALLGSMNRSTQKLVEAAEELAKNTLGEIFPDNMVSTCVDTVLYCIASCFINFSETVEIIRDLNPRARILVSGPYDPLQVETLVYRGFRIDIGNMVDGIVKIVDQYITSVDPNRFHYYYINTPADLQTGVDYLKTVDSIWELNPRTLARMIDDLFSFKHDPSTQICTAVRAEAAELGLDLAGYECLYADNMVEIFENVREMGADAPQIEQMFVGAFETVLDCYLASAKIDEIDLEGYIAGSSVGNGYNTYVYGISCETDPADLTLYQKSAIRIILQGSFLSGIGVHPSEAGCYQKYLAAIQAYRSPLTAGFCAGQVNTGILLNLLDGCLSLRTSLLGGLLGSALRLR